MAQANRKPAAVQAVPVPAPEIEPELAPEPELEEVKPIRDTLYLESIPQYRFVKDGKEFRLELRSSGVYWLYPV